MIKLIKLWCKPELKHVHVNKVIIRESTATKFATMWYIFGKKKTNRIRKRK
jgi:hypothetical protein